MNYTLGAWVIIGGTHYVANPAKLGSGYVRKLTIMTKVCASSNHKGAAGYLPVIQTEMSKIKAKN